MCPLVEHFCLSLAQWRIPFLAESNRAFNCWWKTKRVDQWWPVKPSSKSPNQLQLSHPWRIYKWKTRKLQICQLMIWALNSQCLWRRAAKLPLQFPSSLLLVLTWRLLRFRAFLERIEKLTFLLKHPLGLFTFLMCAQFTGKILLQLLSEFQAYGIRDRSEQFHLSP